MLSGKSKQLKMILKGKAYPFQEKVMNNKKGKK